MEKPCNTMYNNVQIILARPRAEVSKNREIYRKWLCHNSFNLSVIWLFQISTSDHFYVEIFTSKHFSLEISASEYFLIEISTSDHFSLDF